MSPQTRWKRANRRKAAAHEMVRRAVAGGIIIRKPCEVCGHSVSHGHHEDYARPLDVTWLCSIHHYAVHRGIVG